MVFDMLSHVSLSISTPERNLSWKKTEIGNGVGGRTKVPLPEHVLQLRKGDIQSKTGWR